MCGEGQFYELQAMHLTMEVKFYELEAKHHDYGVRERLRTEWLHTCIWWTCCRGETALQTAVCATITSEELYVNRTSLGEACFERHLHLLQIHWNFSLLCCDQGQYHHVIQDWAVYEDKVDSCLVRLFGLWYVTTKSNFIVLGIHNIIRTFTNKYIK